ncbi:MAG: methyltransferase [Ruminococcus sp.]|nr:methyltransferase [Ruminococcus sp.]MDD6635449.1 methyltransferase [Ruminococcus sp.]MDY3214070.1 methyltransferase [Ruminococcus sp.]MDY3844069.1 methyltransferase [Ruminococcus sp.]CDF00478.1 predicted O-methyltransferase [Ruminococcus sp. CAG:624]
MDYSFEKLTDKIFVCASKNHRFGTDAFLLADFSAYRKKDKVCDLGTGCGIIPLIMQKKMPPEIIYAVDIQEDAVEQLKMGMDKSEIRNIIPVHADLKELWKNAPVGQLDLVTCNPPYKAANAGIESSLTAQKIARHEVLCNINDVCHAGERLLKFGGRLCICNRPERLSDVIYAMKKNNIEPKRLRFVSKNADEAPWLFLIEGKKGSKPFMKVEPQMYIRTDTGFTDELNEIYNTGKE